ncbi:MAG: universal stress protein [Acidimicrobiales bacterium]
MVGVSPTTGSLAALRWAAAEAGLRGADVHAVMAWRPPRSVASPGVRPPTYAPTEDELSAQMQARLEEAVASALGEAHSVTCTAMRGGTVAVLLATASDALLLALCAPPPRSAATVRTVLLAPQLMLHAQCPVVVVPSSVLETPAELPAYSG